jgi:GntR family transcriptional regulator
MAADQGVTRSPSLYRKVAEDIKAAIDVIDAVAASAEDSRLLGVRPRAPVLRERRLTTDLAGTPVEWSDDRYLGGAVAFSVRNSVAVNALSRTQPGQGRTAN